jgi:uncharacterized SAM-binding protein YcdF (DUF218 family)
MVILSKLFTIIVLPPGCIIVALILISIFIPRKFKIPLALVTVLLYLLSIQPISDLLLTPLENVYPPLLKADSAFDPDAIVVLGGGTVQGSPEADIGQDMLGTDATKRAVYAFSLRDDYDTPYVLSGGKVFDYNQETEAKTAEHLFISLGLPKGRLILESKSRNTWENARETAELGYKRVILVTSAYHMPRSVFCFVRNGINVLPAPTDYKCDRGRSYNYLSFLPTMGNLHYSYNALHEYIGLLSYRIIYRN